jgi:cytochrome c oxidase assembly protein subunit 11
MTSSEHNIRKTAFWATGLACLMLGAAFAAVPLYDLFCRVTGFDGRPIVVSKQADKILIRTIDVAFDANVAPDLPWRFSPEKSVVTLKIGEATTVSYKTVNEGTEAVTGIATYNVSPAKAAPYFNKIACFCFTDKTLKAGESAESEVTFYIDPALADEPELKDLKGITLSYTFFVSKKPQPVASTRSSNQEALDKSRL